MADPRSYAGTVLPSGGVDPLRLMAQMQAQKAKRDAATKAGKMPDLKIEGALPQDRPFLTQKLTEMRELYSNPQAFIPGSPEQLKAQNAKIEFDYVMAQMSADREAHDALQSKLQAENASAVREESRDENLQFWMADFPTRQKMKQPMGLVYNVDWRTPVDASLDKLDPNEWGTSETVDGGAMIRTTSGKTLSPARVNSLAQSFAFDPKIYDQLGYEAKRRMAKDPKFAEVVAANQAKGVAPEITMILEHAASKPFGGSDTKLTQSGAGFGAGDVSEATAIAEKLTAVAMGGDNMYQLSQSDKEEMLLNLSNVRDKLVKQKYGNNVPISYNQGKFGMDPQFVDITLAVDESQQPIITTGRYAYNTQTDDYFFEVVKPDGTIDFMMFNRRNVPYQTFFDAKKLSKAGAKYILDEKLFDVNTKETRPEVQWKPGSLYKGGKQGGGTPQRGPKPQQATGTPTKGPRPTNP